MDKRRKSSKRKSRRSSSKSSKRSKSSAVSTAEIKKIATDVVKANTPVKWFQTTSYADEAANPIQNQANMYCMGFSVLSPTYMGALPGSGNTVDYGTSTGTNLKPMKTLSHARIFADSEANLTLKLNRPVAQSVHPAKTFTRFLVERTSVDTSTTNGQDALPMFVRVLHLRCRDTAGGQLQYDPRNDAFISPYGEPVGVSSNNFKKRDIVTLEPNYQKYVVCDDVSFQLLPPVVFERVESDPYFPTKDSMRTLDFKHDIGSTLKYTPASATTNRTDSGRFPCQGQHQHFVLFHFQLLGDNGTVRSSANYVRVTAQPVGTFRD